MGVPAIGNVGPFSGAEFDPLMQDREQKLRRAALMQDASNSRQSFMNLMAQRALEEKRLAEDKRQFDIGVGEGRASRQQQADLAGKQFDQQKTLLAAKKKPKNAREAWTAGGLGNLAGDIASFDALDMPYQAAATRAKTAEQKIASNRVVLDGLKASIPNFERRLELSRSFQAGIPGSAVSEELKRLGGLLPAETIKKVDELETGIKQATDEHNAAANDMMRVGTERKKHRFYSGDDNDNRMAKLGKELIRHGGAELPIKLRERKLDTLHDRAARLLEQAAMQFQIPPGADATQRAAITQARNTWLAEQTAQLNKQMDAIEEEISQLAELDNEYFQSFARTYDDSQDG